MMIADGNESKMCDDPMIIITPGPGPAAPTLPQ